MGDELHAFIDKRLNDPGFRAAFAQSALRAWFTEWLGYDRNNDTLASGLMRFLEAHGMTVLPTSLARVTDREAVALAHHRYYCLKAEPNCSAIDEDDYDFADLLAQILKNLPKDAT